MLPQADMLPQRTQEGGGWKGPLEASWSNPLLKQGSPERSVQNQVQMAFEYLQLQTPSKTDAILLGQSSREVCLCMGAEMPYLQLDMELVDPVPVGTPQLPTPASPTLPWEGLPIALLTPTTRQLLCTAEV